MRLPAKKPPRTNAVLEQKFCQRIYPCNDTGSDSFFGDFLSSKEINSRVAVRDGDLALADNLLSAEVAAIEFFIGTAVSAEPGKKNHQ